MTSRAPNPAVPLAPREREEIQDELWQALSDAVDYDSGPLTWAAACMPLVERWREQWIAEASAAALEEAAAFRSKLAECSGKRLALTLLLEEAMQSRAPDMVPNHWAERVRIALAQSPTPDPADVG